MDADKQARDSERRQATVLFADISGFTSMSEQIDPEEVTSVMNRCFAALEEAVHQHGGVVDKYIGDCIMALFGVPHAIEDAPKQAINAAIEIRRRVEQLNRERNHPAPLTVHIGVNSGLVIAGRIGGQMKREFTVIGDTVNLASRLKDVAPVGQIYVGPDTHRDTKDAFEYQPLKPLSLKGKAQPVQAYQLLSTHGHLHRPSIGRGGRMIFSEMVGRERELGCVRQCIAAVLRGAGGIVSIVGDAGLGKSRLMAEVTALEEIYDTTLLEGRSLAIGERLSFHPFVDMLERWAGITDEDGENDAMAKLEAAAAALLGDDVGEVFPFVATLMGIHPVGAHAERLRGIEGEAMERLILKSMKDLFRKLAAAKPVVLVFEDVHWADQSSLKLLQSLMRLANDERIVFINVLRPYYQDSGQVLLDFARAELSSVHTEIGLEPLDHGQCDRLIGNLLQQTVDLPYSIRELIARQAEGNPFYIEEVIRSLIDDGVVEFKDGRFRVTEKIATVVIPGTIQAVIMARVDKLEERTKEVLRVASVIGRSFYYRVIADIVRQKDGLAGDLEYLKERQLILERQGRWAVPVGGRTLMEELEYLFKHALAQQTIYESVLQKTRKELHLQVAQAIESLFADRLADFYGMLAYHFSRAEHLEKAEEYLFKAGDEAARSAAPSEALNYFREASRLYLVMHGEGGDRTKRALLEKNIAMALLNKGNLTESIEHFDEALRLLGQPVPKNPLVVQLRFAANFLSVMSHLYLRRQRPRPVTDNDREVFEVIYNRARALTTSDPKRLFIDNIGGIRALNQTDATQVDQACGMYAGVAALFSFTAFSFDVSRRFLEIARPLVRPGSVRDEFVYRSMRFIHHYLEGDWSEEHAIDRELASEALRFGAFWDVNTYLGLDCDRKLRQGDFAAARRRLEHLAEMRDVYGYEFARPNHGIMHALLRLEERQLAGVLQAVDDYYATRPEPLLRVLALGIRAKIQLLDGDPEGAATSLKRAEDIVKVSGRLPPWHLGYYLLSRLHADVAVLEGDAARGQRPGGTILKRARRDAKAVAAIAAKVAAHRVEAYGLLGDYFWNIGEQDRAIGWWKKGFIEADHLGTKPELARIYLKVGQRLAEGSSRHRDVDGTGADAYVERARTSFGELNLEWDLARSRA